MPRYNPPKILDAEYLLESANDSARHFRNIYAVYLTVMIYIFIIVLSTEQELLFRAGDKQLPLVHIRVPIVEFFTWMPLALLVLHFYLLIQVTFLSDKVLLYKQEISYCLISKEDIRKAKMLLASLPLVHILVEEKLIEEKAKLERKMLYLIVFVSLVVFPLIVLIVTQIKFLPYQDGLITWSHRIVILIDVLMLWGFGRHILESHEGKTIWINSIAGLLLVITPAFVVIVIFINFPGSKIYNPVTASFYELEWVKKIMPNRFVLPDRKLVEREPAPELLAVHLEGQTDNENLINQSSSIWCRYADSLDLEGRNFREAELQGATLCKATLQNANLTEAFLFLANLTGADLWKADLTDADLWRANLTDADLWDANLTDAGLEDANLTDAYLADANLTDASLWRANLTLANIRDANLTSAYLREANLTSTDLRETDFTGADLGRANLTDAYLANANLTDANLIYSNLTAANLSKADFSKALLGDRTILDFTWVWGLSFPKGIPRGWDDTLKPEYLCPEGFDVSDHIDISEYIDEYGRSEQEKLKKRLKQIIEKNCEPYKP